MALTTYAGLIAAVPEWATYSDVDTQLDDFIAWAHQEINRRLRSNVMLASADIAVSAETATPPAGLLAFKRAYLDTSPRRKLTTGSAEAVMDLSTQYQTQVYPEMVALEGSLLRFGPQFTWAGTVKALYYKELDLPDGDTATNAVLTKYPYLYLWGTLQALHVFKEDDNNADLFGGRFDALVEDINSRDARDTMAGELQARPYGGGVV